MRKKTLWMLAIMVACLSTGCTEVRDLANSYEAPTEAIRVTNENEYLELVTEEEILERLVATMKQNKTTCYFNVQEEEMIAQDKWMKVLDGVHTIDVEYTIAASGYNVGVTLTYWDNYPIVYAFQNNDTTLLNTKQLELFDKYCEILGNCTSSSYSEYENELAIHDYLVSNVEYLDTSLESGAATTGTAYEALIEGKSNCGGYVESFKTLLDMLKIDNDVIVGQAGEQEHGWNLVELDGNWYHVDVTYDDPVNTDGTILHKYFNMSDQDIALDHTWVTEDYPKAIGGNYSYYSQKDIKEVSSQEELNEYIASQVESGAQKIEVKVLGNADVALAFSLTETALNITMNNSEKDGYTIYDIGVTYKE
ncbi:MAG: hypothetical protein K6C69_04505 [Lachnospiraceae bacterium]|nr:hypothetical protein [Lachnospiraceae bacterium]